MKRLLILVLLAMTLSACEEKTGPLAPEVEAVPTTLAEARHGFQTQLTRQKQSGAPVIRPPAGVLDAVLYTSPAGELAAYISPSPGDGKKHPLIVWLAGGFSNSISDFVWTPAQAENDQSASVFREQGVLVMYPSLRGGNQNPGVMEGFYGEVDDVIAAARSASALDYVDPQRIYLGGHSTGGTLALLTAESTDLFRAVFAFGPVEDMREYGQKNLPFKASDAKEGDLRAPIKWLRAIRSRTFVLEGTRGNIDSLKALAKAPHSSVISFHPISKADHFDLLQPISRLIAAKIKSDSGAETNIALSTEELSAARQR